MPEVRSLNEQPGIKTHGNPVNLPPGSAIECKNWKCPRDNVYSKVRGRKCYGSGLPAQDIEQLLQYKDRLLCHMGNNTLYYDSDGAGTFTQYTGTYTAPETGYKMQSLETSGNLYITDDVGIKRTDSLTTDFVNAGVPKGLSFDLRIIDSVNWMTDGNTASYRVVWSYLDSNSNKHIGAPSERQEITNSSGNDRAVELRIYIPTEITVNYLVEIYRSSQQVGSPPEDFQLVYQAYPTAAEIAARVMQVNDILPDDWRGTSLYTNTTQEGISQANERPPKANTLTRYKDYTIYGNIENLQRLYTALISTSNITAGTSTITINDGTNTETYGCVTEIAFKTINNPGVSDDGGFCEIKTTVAHTMAVGDYVRLVDVVGAAAFVAAVEGKTYEITAVNAADEFTITEAWVAGYSATAGSVLQYEDYGTTPRFILHTTGTDAQNIENTAKSIVRCVNLSTDNVWWDAYYNSTALDPVGKILITTKTMGADALYLIVNSTATGGNFTPVIPTAGTTYISTNDNFQHAVMWSKNGQPEAVPLVNIQKIGSQDDPVLKVIGLRDSLMIIKKKDGVWQMTGNSPSNFDFHELDGTVTCLQLNSIVKGENDIEMFSDAGYVKISDVGVEVIGRDTEKDDLKPVQVAGFDTNGYGWYYDNEKSYNIATYTDQDSTANDNVKVFNTFTRAWTTREVGVYTNDTAINMGIVVDDLEYTAPISGSGLLVERKDIALTDYATPDIDNTIAGINTDDKSITLGTAITIHDNAILLQGGVTRVINVSNSDTQLTLESVTGLAIDMGSVNVADCADNGAGLIRVTTAVIHGLATNNGVTIAGVTGTTEANGTWIITVIDATHFDLVSSTFVNAYTAAGTVTNAIIIIPGIESTLKYQQIHGGMPEYDKKFSHATIFFDNDETSFKNIQAVTSTDSDPTEQTTNLIPSSSNFWGDDWVGLWGDRKESNKMLILIPNEHASASQLYISVVHSIPREKGAICGYSVIFEITDVRYKK